MNLQRLSSHQVELLNCVPQNLGSQSMQYRKARSEIDISFKFLMVKKYSEINCSNSTFGNWRSTKQYKIQSGDLHVQKHWSNKLSFYNLISGVLVTNQKKAIHSDPLFVCCFESFHLFFVVPLIAILGPRIVKNA